jgi:signal transduction histidine kinase
MAASLLAYLAIVVPHGSFDTGNAYEVKQLGVRLATLVTGTVMANMVVRIERRRRRLAVQSALAAHLDRERVAQEIHDSVAQEIYMLAVSLEANTKIIEQQTSDPALHERMQALVRLSKQALLETRSVLFSLEPALAGEEGVVQLLRGQAEEFSAVTRIPVTVSATCADIRLEPAETVEVYRIVQEALANVYKHSGAASAEIAIRHTDGALSIRLADDGSGFDEATLLRRGHGLASMRDRATRLGGALALASAPGCGTTITVTLPLREV